MFHLPTPQQKPTKPVVYCGVTIGVPVDHNWVAVIKLGKAGNDECLLVSFGSKPVLSESGLQWQPVDSEFAILGQVSKVDPTTLVDSLQQVDGFTDNAEILLANTKELAYKIGRVVDAGGSTQDILHAIFCPDHGIFPEYLDHTGDILDELYSDDEDEDDEPSFAAQELGAGLADLIATAMAEQPEQPKAEAKPRVRVLTASSLEDALVQLGFPIGKA